MSSLTQPMTETRPTTETRHAATTRATFATTDTQRPTSRTDTMSQTTFSPSPSPRDDATAATAPATPPGTSGTAYPDPPAPRDVPGLPFARLVRLELRKATNTRGGQGIMIAILAVTAVVVGLTMWLARDGGASFQTLLLATATPQGMLVPILGILTACSEWSQRTALVTFTQEPRRLRVMAAKTVAAAVLGLVVLVATVLLSAAAHALSTTLAGGSVDLDLTLAQVTNLALMQLFSVVQGVAFGALFLSVPIAIVAFFMAPVVVTVLTMTISWLGERAEWFDMGTAAAPLLGSEWLTTGQWAHLGSVTVIWLVVPLVVGLWRVVRREVK